MFVRDFLAVEQPFELVAPRLLQDAAWLDPIAHDAVAEAIDALVMPLRWDTKAPRDVLPTLISDLEVLPLGRARSHLVMSATCHPDAADPTTGRVVDTSVRAFLRGLAARLGGQP